MRKDSIPDSLVHEVTKTIAPFYNLDRLEVREHVKAAITVMLNSLDNSEYFRESGGINEVLWLYQVRN